MKELLKKKNVVAVVHGHKITAGVDTGRAAVVVYVTKKMPLIELNVRDIIPKTIEGIESDVQETGEIKALADRTGKWRPAPGGVSIGHPDVSAGTLGMIVKRYGLLYILSNNHVLANSNEAYINDESWQPGRIDGGSSTDIIGHLSNFIKIEFEGDESTCPVMRLAVKIGNFFPWLFHRKSRFTTIVQAINKVDCAISYPRHGEYISEEIFEIGKPKGFNFGEVQFGDVVKKSGRTSGVTQGTVIGSGGIAKVNYGNKVAVFENQIFTTAIAQGGDSGSVVLNDKNEVIGLLFAGSDSMTIVNKIANVVYALDLDY